MKRYGLKLTNGRGHHKLPRAEGRVFPRLSRRAASGKGTRSDAGWSGRGRLGTGALGGGVATPARRATDWTTFGYDKQRTGFNPGETALGPGTSVTLRLGWSARLGGRGHHPAAGRDPRGRPRRREEDLVYVGGGGGDAVAVDRATGEVIGGRGSAGSSSPAAGSSASPARPCSTAPATPSTSDRGRRQAARPGRGDRAAMRRLAGPGHVASRRVDVVWAGLTLVGGSLYVEVAGACGDTGPYRGQAIRGRRGLQGRNQDLVLPADAGALRRRPLGVRRALGRARRRRPVRRDRNALGAYQDAAYSEHVVRLSRSLKVVAAKPPEAGRRRTSTSGPRRRSTRPRGSRPGAWR